MKLRTALFVIGMAAQSAGAEICPKLEFAELDSMTGPEVLKLHCEYRNNLHRLGEQGSGSAASWKATVACSEEIERTRRIAAKKYGIGGPEVTRMCAPK